MSRAESFALMCDTETLEHRKLLSGLRGKREDGLGMSPGEL